MKRIRKVSDHYEDLVAICCTFATLVTFLPRNHVDYESQKKIRGVASQFTEAFTQKGLPHFRKLEDVNLISYRRILIAALTLEFAETQTGSVDPELGQKLENCIQIPEPAREAQR